MPPERRRRRAWPSLTPLIDVIFLLLLFFMLSSTFSKFAEIELTPGGDGASFEAPAPTFFLRIESDRVTLNGRDVALGDLERRLGEDARVIVSVTGAARAQALADVLVALRGVPGLALSVVGPG